MVLDVKSLQEYPLNVGVPQGSLDPKRFLLYINDLPDDVICNIAIYTNDTTHYSKWAWVCFWRHIFLKKRHFILSEWISFLTFLMKVNF